MHYVYYKIIEDSKRRFMLNRTYEKQLNSTCCFFDRFVKIYFINQKNRK